MAERALPTFSDIMKTSSESPTSQALNLSDILATSSEAGDWMQSSGSAAVAPTGLFNNLMSSMETEKSAAEAVGTKDNKSIDDGIEALLKDFDLQTVQVDAPRKKQRVVEEEKPSLIPRESSSSAPASLSSLPMLVPPTLEVKVPHAPHNDMPQAPVLDLKSPHSSMSAELSDHHSHCSDGTMYQTSNHLNVDSKGNHKRKRSNTATAQMRRMQSNRKAAAKYRLKKKQYVTNLESKVKSLEDRLLCQSEELAKLRRWKKSIEAQVNGFKNFCRENPNACVREAILHLRGP
eukprot:CAMPEP_0167753900 /NCGR_PEP_ID=MMETSP0110_2-20121227/7972_1 /TAXON_ID=629695 /ORGANISM="Gymnochlora sp., Strain CCMP2014" /LENGTH=290 /DNA_ID=CAMNT_0007639721 /DNA_START=66 /DNA_END=938 /DNA_ORIENTATION=-